MVCPPAAWLKSSMYTHASATNLTKTRQNVNRSFVYPSTTTSYFRLLPPLYILSRMDKASSLVCHPLRKILRFFSSTIKKQTTIRYVSKIKIRITVSFYYSAKLDDE